MADSSSSSRPRQPRTHTRTRTRTRIQVGPSHLDSSKSSTRKARRRKQRRQLRDRQSVDLDESLQVHQRQGFHWNDDLCAGNQAYSPGYQAGDSNRKPDVFAVRLSKPLQVHTRSSSGASAYSAPLMLTSSSVEHERVGRHRIKRSKRNRKSPPNERGRSISILDIKTTDLEALPHGHPLDRPQSRCSEPSLSYKSEKCTRYPCSDLSEVHIPTPQLYHKRSRQMLTDFLEDSLNMKCEECQKQRPENMFSEKIEGNTSDDTPSTPIERSMSKGSTQPTPPSRDQSSGREQAQTDTRSSKHMGAVVVCSTDRSELPPILTTSNCYRYTSTFKPESRNLSNATVLHRTNGCCSASYDQAYSTRAIPSCVSNLQFPRLLVNEKHLDRGTEKGYFSRREDIDLRPGSLPEYEDHAHPTSACVQQNLKIFINTEKTHTNVSSNMRIHCSCSVQLDKPQGDSCTVYQYSVCGDPECIVPVLASLCQFPHSRGAACLPHTSSLPISRPALSKNESSMAGLACFSSQKFGLNDRDAEGCTYSDAHKQPLNYDLLQFEELFRATPICSAGLGTDFIDPDQGESEFDAVTLTHQKDVTQPKVQEPISELNISNRDVSSDEWENVC